MSSSTSAVCEISSLSDLRNVLSKNTHVIVDFYATWCGPCRSVAPMFNELAAAKAQYRQIAFAKVNVDNCSDVAQYYSVTAMPTFLIFTKSNLVKTIRGADIAAVRRAIASLNTSTSSNNAFQSPGYTLGGSRPAASSSSLSTDNLLAWLISQIRRRNMASTVLLFISLYVVSFFALNALHAVQNSPFHSLRSTR